MRSYMEWKLHDVNGRCRKNLKTRQPFRISLLAEEQQIEASLLRACENSLGAHLVWNLK